MRLTTLRLAAALSFSASLALASPLTPAEQGAIDRNAEAVLSKTGVPAASIAIVRGGEIVYLKAYGSSRLEPKRAAEPGDRYAIGSISKQFTAAAILLLAEDGRLSLEDPVGKYVPGLASGDRISIRRLLSMTAGYRDYWPQDYVPADMTRPVSHTEILDRWARKDLDFKPGDSWQYSNTSYTIAGIIVEKVSRQPLMDFLQARIFKPLGMTSVTDIDAGPLPAADARGYTRYALGPLHPAVKEGKGWLFAMGGLAMTAEDLARWDVSVIKRSLLKPASYVAQQTPAKLNSGKETRYGLGVSLGRDGERRYVEHGGEVSGFLAENKIYPDDASAVVVLTSADFGGAETAIADRIVDVLYPKPAPPEDADTRAARAFFDQLRNGAPDRSLLSANGAAYFSAEAVADFQSSLGPMGEPVSFTRTNQGQRGGMSFAVYALDYGDGHRLRIIQRNLADGKIEQFLVQPLD